jgi:hypothetical protein
MFGVVVLLKLPCGDRWCFLGAASLLQQLIAGRLAGCCILLIKKAAHMPVMQM